MMSIILCAENIKNLISPYSFTKFDLKEHFEKTIITYVCINGDIGRKYDLNQFKCFIHACYLKMCKIVKISKTKEEVIQRTSFLDHGRICDHKNMILHHFKCPPNIYSCIKHYPFINFQQVQWLISEYKLLWRSLEWNQDKNRKANDRKCPIPIKKIKKYMKELNTVATKRRNRQWSRHEISRWGRYLKDHQNEKPHSSLRDAIKASMQRRGIKK